MRLGVDYGLLLLVATIVSPLRGWWGDRRMLILPGTTTARARNGGYGVYYRAAMATGSFARASLKMTGVFGSFPVRPAAL